VGPCPEVGLSLVVLMTAPASFRPMPATSRRPFSLPADFADIVDSAWARMSAAPGFLTEREGRFLALAAAVGPETGAILEIGSFKGKSTVGLATVARHYGCDPIIAVDPHTSPSSTDPDLQGASTSFDDFQNSLRIAGVENAVEVHRTFSGDLARTWTRPIRLLWIDGDHSYAGARADLDLYQPFLVEGAIVALHDALHPFDGPIRVMVEHILTSENFGPVGFCGSIAWAQYRPKTGGSTFYRRMRESLARRASRLIPFVRDAKPLGRVRFLLWKLARAGVPHDPVDPVAWTAMVAKPLG
jgi:MMP 1-O-methyltransferase